MTTDNLTATLTALLDHWNTLAQDAAERVNTTPPDIVSDGFYTGVIFGMETAYNNLTAVVKGYQA